MIDVFIPAIGNPELLDRCVTLLITNASEHAGFDITIIDNGSNDPLMERLGWTSTAFVRNSENAGMVASLQQAKRLSSANILIFMHSDFLVHEEDWNDKIAAAFENDPKLGLLGAVGGSVAEPNGGRAHVLCSLRDAHIHGKPTPPGVHPAVLLDGCCMIFRRNAMNAIPDVSFPVHHFHDKDWSLQMIMNGYRVGVIQLDCEHLSSQTSCQPECQATFAKYGGEQAIYNSAERKFLEKWRPMLPISVDVNWNYSTRVGPVKV